MIGPVFEALYITNVALFGALLGWFGVTALSRRRRGAYDTYAGNGVLIIDTGRGVLDVQTLAAWPRLAVQMHFAEHLRNTAWTGHQDVYAEVEVVDSGIASLGAARTRIACGGGASPTWTGNRGVVVIVMPATRLDLTRLEVRVRLVAKNSLCADDVLGATTLGRLDDIGDGLPREVGVAPQGKVTFTAQTTNVNDGILPNLPVAIARPM